MSEVLIQASIHPQNFQLSRQEFLDQRVSQLTGDGQRYTRALLGVRGNTTCSMAQSCQVGWQITIPKERLALQLNAIVLPANINIEALARSIVNFNGQDDPQADWTKTMEVGVEATKQPINVDERIKLWIDYSTACGPLQQIAISKDNTKLWQTSIYAREQAVIAANSLSDLCTNNSINVSSLESIVRGRRHCGIFLDIPVSAFAAGSFNYKFPFDITIAGVLDLNQLNPIFNSFPVLTRNYASVYLQLWSQGFLQDLKVVWLNKSDTMMNQHLAYQKIPPEKPDIVHLLNTAGGAHFPYSVRIVNIEGKLATERKPTNSISQIKDAKFNRLDIINFGFNMENEEAFIDMIRTQKILNFPTQIIRTQSTNFPFRGFVTSGGSMQIDQRHLIQQDYVSLNLTVTSQKFECFVEQDLVSPPSDLYHSLNFQNRTINEGESKFYYGRTDNIQETENIFYNTTLCIGSKAVKVYCPHKFMLAWKMATDDSFMRGYNVSKMGARTNIQVSLTGSLIEGIVGTQLIKVNAEDDQNNHISFIATRANPTPIYAQITPQLLYQCDAIIRFTFNDAPDPQVLIFEIIGEVGGTMIRSG
ncbi:MAG: hypothetical protein EZS28_006822 [Streblomastix strix]|uniref:Uncharacterized protein n=1 Tax=Streblomastix strix TaxID=222440 RepID=A0A5J4WSZ0_9EUKA|nr:MAG: hypothetical protein EZS28_006822 [Streblomastix strix]